MSYITEICSKLKIHIPIHLIHAMDLMGLKSASSCELATTSSFEDFIYNLNQQVDQMLIRKLSMPFDVKSDLYKHARQHGFINGNYTVNFIDKISLQKLFANFGETFSSDNQYDRNKISAREDILLRKLKSKLQHPFIQGLTNIRVIQEAGTTKALCPVESCAKKLVIIEKSRGNFHDSTYIGHVVRHFTGISQIEFSGDEEDEKQY